jgi:hypothetical protein
MAKVDTNDRSFKIQLPKDCKAYVPTLEREVEVSSLLFTCKMVSARVLRGQTLDPFLLQKAATTYEYKNIIKGSIKSFALVDLEIGFGNIFNPGKFYFDPKTEFSYFCKKVENESASMFLVESYQHELLLQAEVEMDSKYASHYIEVTDRAEIERLRKLLAHYLE